MNRQELIDKGGNPLMEVDRGELFRGSNNALLVLTPDGQLVNAVPEEVEAWEREKAEMAKVRQSCHVVLKEDGEV